MEYDNTNKGVLFRNNEKGEGDKKPDYTGKLNVNGKDFRLMDSRVKDRNQVPVHCHQRAKAKGTIQ